MIWMSAAASTGPNQPCAPNSRTQTRPEITGETENGRSIRVVSRPRPGKSNRPMHQAAAMPQTAFSGTLIAATIRVSQIELRASGIARASAAPAPGRARTPP